MPKKSVIQEYDAKTPVRLNKFLSDSGVCSRREADRMIEAGKVMVDGVRAQMGMKVNQGQVVICNGVRVNREEELVLIAFNKPVGIECTSDRSNPDNIIDFVNYPKRIYTIGRLDKNSHGLILMTNDGNIVNKISKSVNGHEKEYIVRVNKPITKEFISKMQSGVKILDRYTRPCRIKQENKDTFRIVLTQGMNRQIRRMCEALGYRVLELERVRIMNITLGNLKTGTYRNLTKGELNGLLKLIKDSTN